MRGPALSLAAFNLAGCGPRPGASPASDPALIEPATFSGWPSATEHPVPVGPDRWILCRPPTPEEARAQDGKGKLHGPHASHSIVVRVSPEAVAAFRAGDRLPSGAVVIKEKYADRQASSPLREYAVMAKREPGYDPAGVTGSMPMSRLGPSGRSDAGGWLRVQAATPRPGSTISCFAPTVPASSSSRPD